MLGGRRASSDNQRQQGDNKGTHAVATTGDSKATTRWNVRPQRTTRDTTGGWPTTRLPRCRWTWVAAAGSTLLVCPNNAAQPCEKAGCPILAGDEPAGPGDVRARAAAPSGAVRHILEQKGRLWSFVESITRRPATLTLWLRGRASTDVCGGLPVCRGMWRSPDPSSTVASAGVSGCRRANWPGATSQHANTSVFTGLERTRFSIGPLTMQARAHHRRGEISHAHV